MWLMVLVAPWYVGSSQIRDRTHVSCIPALLYPACPVTFHFVADVVYESTLEAPDDIPHQREGSLSPCGHIEAM